MDVTCSYGYDIIIALVYLGTIAIPINGLLYLARRVERQRVRKLVIQYWKLRGGRFNGQY